MLYLAEIERTAEQHDPARLNAIKHWIGSGTLHTNDFSQAPGGRHHQYANTCGFPDNGVPDVMPMSPGRGGLGYAHSLATHISTPFGSTVGHSLPNADPGFTQ